MIVDSERSENHIDFTMMFPFVIHFYGSSIAPLFTEYDTLLY